jgi:tRNA 2-thiouridine synthesizing protein C
MRQASQTMSSPSGHNMKRLLFILRSTPYGSSHAQEGIDTVLAASVFEQHITVLFMDEGVWQLHAHQQTIHNGNSRSKNLIAKRTDRKNIAAQLESFPLYEINEIFVDKKSLDRFQLKKQDLILEPELVDDKKIRQLISDSNIVFTY